MGSITSSVKVSLAKAWAWRYIAGKSASRTRVFPSHLPRMRTRSSRRKTRSLGQRLTKPTSNSSFAVAKFVSHRLKLARPARDDTFFGCLFRTAMDTYRGADSLRRHITLSLFLSSFYYCYYYHCLLLCRLQ